MMYLIWTAALALGAIIGTALVLPRRRDAR
jgi:hypothetical protein